MSKIDTNDIAQETHKCKGCLFQEPRGCTCPSICVNLSISSWMPSRQDMYQHTNCRKWADRNPINA